MSPFFAPLVEVLNRPEAWAYLPASYLAGSIPFGLILALTVSKQDVRAAGSGNIGATNVARVVGKKLGLVTLFLDALKGAAPVAATFLLDMPEAHRVVLAAAAGLCAFLGHCFPVWLKFKGGKGVATGAGVMLAHLPVVAAVGIGAFAVVFAISKKVSLGSLTGAAAIVIALPLLVPFDVSVAVVIVMFAVLVLRHTSNIKRLLRKEELKV